VNPADASTREEYEARFHAAQKVSGRGINTTQHFPCPFCAAPDWLVTQILLLGTSGTKSRPCASCGRSARFEFTRTPSSITFRLVQTAGDDPAPYLAGMSRREGEGAVDPPLGGISRLPTS
jgi:hypothetical protein